MPAPGAGIGVVAGLTDFGTVTGVTSALAAGGVPITGKFAPPVAAGGLFNGVMTGAMIGAIRVAGTGGAAIDAAGAKGAAGVLGIFGTGISTSAGESC